MSAALDLTALWPAAIAVGLVGCGQGEDDGGLCGGEPCMVPSTRAELLEAVEGFADPVAGYLRQAAKGDGTVGEDYLAVLDGVGDELGCGRETQSSFVVLSNQKFAPKGLVTRCSADPQEASRLFAVFEPETDQDLDAERFRLASWDPDAGAYRRYQMVPAATGELTVAVEPGFCAGCHGGPHGLEAWTPIMNEMTNPWAQWHAQPDFESFQFEEAFPAGAGGDVYDAIAAAQQLDSASNLEPIVRAAIDRVSNARVAARDDAADAEAALDLLRPVFCDESVNFVSEVHRSGELQSRAVTDPALRRMFLALDPSGWPWAWLSDDTIRMQPPSDAEEPLALIAVRGETTVQAEAALVSRLVLTPTQVLRVRALDWMNPVASNLRCELFEAGAQRVREGIDAAAFASNADLLVAAYHEVMHVETARGLVSLVTADEGSVLALPNAQDADARAAFMAGDFSGLELTLEALGAAIQTHYDEIQGPGGRDALGDERVRRGCLVRQRFSIAPIIPGLEGSGTDC